MHHIRGLFPHFNPKFDVIKQFDFDRMGLHFGLKIASLIRYLLKTAENCSSNRKNFVRSRFLKQTSMKVASREQAGVALPYYGRPKYLLSSCDSAQASACCSARGRGGDSLKPEKFNPFYILQQDCRFRSGK